MMATNILHAVCDNLKRNSQLTEAGFEGKILAHHAKPGYDYPTIRLPFTFSGLTGLRTRIYQAAHRGALAFPVVVSLLTSHQKTVHINIKTPSQPPKPAALTWRTSPVRIRSSPSFVCQLDVQEASDDARVSIYLDLFESPSALEDIRRFKRHLETSA